MRTRRLPDTLYNPVSLAGGIIAAVAFGAILFLTLVEFLQADAPAYIGIISYVLLPVPLVAGLLLIPLGVWREKRRLRSGRAASRMAFTLDLNLPRHRSAAAFFSGGTLLLLLFTAYGSYRAFEWTESTEFCGATCHEVMEPEYTAYQHSPHARVPCVDCHVGSGADWYLRSKLSGAYQVYAVAVNSFPRPIPTPIRNLRPAQETCERCHWPSHFAGEKKYVNTYFKSDEANTRWTLALLMKIGGGARESGPVGGIHWHMNIANEVTYASADSQRQVIPWVRVRNRATGKETEYRAPEAPAGAALEELPAYRMDCIDCHNRPSHIYRPPARIVDRSMALDEVSTALPGVRAAAIGALVLPYSSSQAARDSIPQVLRASYEENDPEIAESREALIARSGEVLAREYLRNFFPRMGVSWRAYPNNIGHMNDVGCFRCHDGRHAAPDGRVITKDCNSCHAILSQGTDPIPSTLTVGGLPFEHPEDIGDAWMDTNCSECHTGG
ncbi:MAG: NapC/NirT family cytochrome c [Bacteroidota bacterium]